MIFLTIGTQFPFNRLLKAVDDCFDDGLINEEIFAQIGDSSYRPHNFKAVSSLEKHLFDKHIREASCIISHAGIGSITMALNYNKPLLVMPRRKRFKEHVNDHQVATARKFEEFGHILVAYQEEDLPEKIKELKSFVPRPRKNQAKAVADRIAKFLDEVSSLRES